MGVKGQMVSLGRTHKYPKCLQNKGETNKTTIGLITGIGLKSDPKQGKTPKGQMVPFFTQPQQYWGSRKQKIAGNVRLPKHINAGYLIYLRFMKHKMLDFFGRRRFSKHKNAGNSEGLYLHEVQKKLDLEDLNPRSTKKLEF